MIGPRQVDCDFSDGRADRDYAQAIGGELGFDFRAKRIVKIHDVFSVDPTQFKMRDGVLNAGANLQIQIRPDFIGERGQALAYNTTGTPGMATGGMGDVLTGLLAALLGQRLTPYDAARVGAWLCGHAAEIAISAGESEESLSATHVIRRLGATFRDLRARVF